MADFNYKLLTEIKPIATPSASVYVNAAATASYIRQIVLYNTTGSVEQVKLWKYISGSAITPMSNTQQFFNYGLSGSATFILDFGPPGLMLTQSYDAIYASSTTNNIVNIVIMGGTE